MKINWFTVIAQVINFIILVWLLKRFLYGPVLEAIDAREKLITSRLHDAKIKKEQAKEQQDKFEEKNKQFDDKKKELMDKAIADTKVEKDKLMEDVRIDVDAFHDKQRKTVAEKQENVSKELVRRTQQQVFDITKMVLTDMASVDLEEQTTRLFISRLEQLKGEEEQLFIDSFKKGSKPILIISAFELPKERQTEIKKAVDTILDKEAEFEFRTAPEMISGIELSANGYKLSWSIAAYLGSMQTDISEMFKGEAGPAPREGNLPQEEPDHEYETVQESK